MGGGTVLLGRPVEAFKPAAKKSGDRLLSGELIAYTITYQGPADGGVFSKNGATFPITLKDKDGNEYTGTMWLKLTKRNDGTYDVQMKIKAKDKNGKEIELDYDSKRDGGKPGTVEFKGLKMTVTFDIRTNNDLFNKNMDEGVSKYTLATNPISGKELSSVTFDKHPVQTGVLEGTGPIRRNAQLRMEHAGADYIGFSLIGMAGQAFDAKLYDVSGREVRALGAGGLRATTDEEHLQFDLQGLAAGTYYLVVASEKAKISLPFVITR